MTLDGTVAQILREMDLDQEDLGSWTARAKEILGSNHAESERRSAIEIGLLFTLSAVAIQEVDRDKAAKLLNGAKLVANLCGQPGWRFETQDLTIGRPTPAKCCGCDGSPPSEDGHALGCTVLERRRLRVERDHYRELYFRNGGLMRKPTSEDEDVLARKALLAIGRMSEAQAEAAGVSDLARRIRESPSGAWL